MMNRSSFVCGAVLGLGLLAFVNSALSANKYVRPTARGSANGADWNNAWSMANLNSNMGSLAAGDTVWIAGGSYSTGLNVTKSGTSGNYITFQRPRTTDSVPASAAGWSSGFDSVIAFSAARAVTITGNYVSVSGRTNYGIKATVPNTTGTPQGIRVSGTSNIVSCMECEGPGVGANFAGYVEGIGAYGSDNTVSNVYAHGFNQIVTTYSSTGWVFDHCVIADCGNGTGDPEVGGHSNMIEYLGASNFTFRYCTFRNWQVVGFELWGGPSYGTPVSGSLYIYGCVIGPCSQDFIWASRTGGDNKGPIYFYNNTVIDAAISMGRGDSTSTSVLDSASRARNNIYWNISMWCGPWYPAPGTASAGIIVDRDYEFASTATQAGNPSGTHCIVNGSNPFVNYAGGNYHIITDISATLPRNKGFAVANANGQVYNLDPDGNTRGADGAWDIGAFEYGDSVASTNAVIVVSPGSLDFGSVPVGTTSDLTFTVQNTGGSTLSGTASVAVPFSIIAGGTYSLGANQSQAVTVRFSPTAVGSTNRTVTFSGGDGATAIVSGAQVPAPIPGSLTFEAEAGSITAPFVVASGYICQSSETSVTNGGRAVYNFAITNAGDYIIEAMVNAPDAGQNSFFVNMDAEPQDPSMTWEIPVTIGFQSRIVGWQGNGTWDNPQFARKVFKVTTGSHQLIIRGREAGTQLDRLSLVQLAAPPSNLAVVFPP